MKKVLLYGRTLTPCGYCDKMKSMLKEHSIRFEFKDVKDHKAEFANLGVDTVPQVMVDGRLIGGWDKAVEILAAVNKRQVRMVIKRDGSKQPWSDDKINRMCEWMCEGLEGVSPSEIAMQAKVKWYEGITTSEVHECMYRSAADLITVEEPQYEYAAARGRLFLMRKRAFGRLTPPTLWDQVRKQTKAGWYDKDILNKYSHKEMILLDSLVIDHDRDFDYTYVSMTQWDKKYLMQNRTTGEIFESPQFAILLIAMCLHQEEHPDVRMDKVARFYHDVSTQKTSLPTPIMAGVRTRTRQFSSCVLIDTADTMDSIKGSVTAIMDYVSLRAGIGCNVGAIRAKGAPVRGGEVVHTGVVGIIKQIEASMWPSQGGVRKGSANLFYPWWHMDVESLLVLKNNRGIDSTRARDLDYGIQLNKFFYERVKSGKDICLFSPSERVGKLYEYFFSDQEKFAEMYLELEADDSVPRKYLKSSEFGNILSQERAQTGRIYIMHVDHANSNSPFIITVRMSNLCVEVILPTAPLSDSDPEEGEIALCTLSAFNLGKVDKLSDLEGQAYNIVNALDNLLDYQDYPLRAAEKSKDRRTLGVGVTNYAYYIAKRGAKYTDGSANNMTHELFEAMQYYLLKASNRLAKEKGRCKLFHETTYSQGILPIDRYKRDIDNFHTAELLLDWEGLRADILRDGLRNSTLTAIMPCETSSQTTNSTNGIEPPKSDMTIKDDNDGKLPQLVPDVANLAGAYEYKWDQESCHGYLVLCGIMQKFVDQSISTNTFYDPARYKNGVTATMIMKTLMFAYRLGLKTLYYHQTNDGNNQEEEGCAGGACKL